MTSIATNAETQKLQLVVSLASSGQLDAAATKAADMVDGTLAAEAWLAISRANADIQRFPAARMAVENALRNRPGDPVLRLENARLMDAVGMQAEALAEFEALERDGHGSPQLAVLFGRALEFAGRQKDAELRVTAALERWPADVPLHTLLAELRWSRGAGGQLTEKLEQAIERFPADLKLRLVAADALRNAGLVERALELVREGLRRAPQSSAFLTSVGLLLDSLGRTAEALPYLQSAVALAPASVPARRNLLPALLKGGDAGEALRVCEGLLAQLPNDQQLIAWRATALRALGHEDYARLHDYSRLVRCYRLSTTRGGGIAEFNAEFAAQLRALHRQERRPLTQSLRGGTQTDRALPATLPVIAEFFAMLEAPIRDYIARLGELDAGHPTARRARPGGGHRISGSWSVELKPDGFHVSHVHPAGWLSSAYYVELPAVLETGKREGWLAFGEPGIAVAGLAADHFVRPEPGMLVLFPSYLWHGTVPFGGDGRRLTAAFDVLPD